MLKSLRTPKTAGEIVTLHWGGVQLDAQTSAKPEDSSAEATPAVVEVPKRKWIHVATEGSFAGHGDGKFTLDLGVFQAFVDRLRADPRYKAGDDGVGGQPVVPFDYEHASEMDPTSGSIPQGGAVSPAWVLDLKAEKDANGKAQLYAFVEFGDTVREQIQKNEYRFVSIAFALESVDRVTGEPAGPVITSIAFTNHPFLQELTPLAASRKRGGRQLGYYYGDAASSPEQAFEFTRCILQLPAATTIPEVITELTKVSAWADSPATAPAGVDIQDIMEQLRKAWSIPVTATAADLVAQATKAAANLVNPSTAPTGAAATSTTETSIMSEKLKKLFASRFNKGHVKLDDEEAVTEAITEALESGDVAKNQLASVLKALGVNDSEKALAAIPELQAARAALADALSQLDQALTLQAQQDTAAETQDVAAAMSARGITDTAFSVSLASHRESLFNQHLSAAHKAAGTDAAGNPKRPAPQALADARKEARKAFLAHYGVAAEGQQRLLSNIVAAPNGVQLVPPTGSTQPVDQSRTLSGGAGGMKTISLAGIRGPNPFARLCDWVKANEPSIAKLGWDAVTSRAKALRDSKEFEIVDAA
jgi:hypothetical protein